MTVFFTVLSSFALALYVAPDSKRRWEWITPGSLLGTLVLLAISLVFRIYTQNWAHYSATYGSIDGNHRAHELDLDQQRGSVGFRRAQSSHRGFVVPTSSPRAGPRAVHSVISD